MIVSFHQIELSLSSHKIIYIKEFDALLISDLHLGKTASFARLGVALVKEESLTTLKRFQLVLDLYQPKKCYILGDLFHNKLPENNDIDIQFRSFLEKNSKTTFYLTLGNHDEKHHNQIQSFQLHTEFFFELGPFILSHKKRSHHKHSPTIIGHHHPGIKFKKRGFSKLTLPCFYFQDTTLICPAFGDFTGLRLLNHNEAIKVVAIITGKNRSLYEL